ncbi:Glycosyl transferase family 2 [Caballeronia arationis]|uniref:Glycosyl transferase family 2 n=1 Tax=Caballeronia arationis TaxID=1777142 RepID=A0A7Z7N463_9BURK|nr:glycoside hydrolase family 99-like domain-containing protein [Caballeronia arationis]SOE80818.1 Glycosyl transferase family 2 [Caballeronia arationis]
MSNPFFEDTAEHQPGDEREARAGHIASEPAAVVRPDDLAWDGERYIPGMSTEIELEHMHRYVVARKLAAGKRVLDIACGEGYGSYALALSASSVVGVDISEDAVQHATKTYTREGLPLEFKVGSAAAIPLPDASVDLVVSFETIEHHDQHEAMIAEIRRVLKPGGSLIISSPNKHEYSDVTGYANPFHVKELYLGEFEALLREKFPNVEIYGQRVLTGSWLAPLDDRAVQLRTLPSEDTDALEHPGVARPLYFIAVASDGALPVLDGTVYEAPAGVGADIGKVAEGRVECKLYWRSDEEGYSEQKSMGCHTLADGTLQTVSLSIREPRSTASVASLRFDPCDRPAVIQIDNLSVQTASGEVVWSWDRDPASLMSVSGAFFLAAAGQPTLIAFSDDAWFELPVPAEAARCLGEGSQLVARLRARGEISFITQLLAEADSVLSDFTNALREAQASVGLTSANAAGTGDPDAVRSSMVSTHGQRVYLFEKVRDGVAWTRSEWVQLVHSRQILRESTEALDESRDALQQSRDGLHQSRAALRAAESAYRESVQTFRHEMASLEGRLLDQSGVLAERDNRILEVTRALESFTSERSRLVSELHVRDAETLSAQARAASAEAQLNAAHARIAELLASSSWRVTAPVRFAVRLARGGNERAAAIRTASKVVYRRVPAPGPVKRKIKGACFRLMPGIFSHTKAYKDWSEFRSKIREASAAAQARHGVPEDGQAAPQVTEMPGPPAEPVIDEANLSSQLLPVPSVGNERDYQAFPPVAPRQVPVRAIAFYLPQFHPFAENDEWWGRGFTEWTNVTRAVPQFDGHYQPHLPGELGFYDLRIPDVQRRQVELAKAAGLGGFCFYFYWFGGKRLMEAPVLQYLEHQEFDLPFCLCWANENWTRRWDGLDQELLISQHHSPEDDLAFISHISVYLRDPRYIRIDGRPVLIVYRPTLLPDVKATVARWRQWARENGLGELYLAYTQSFDRFDPREYGFDAAIEFPPNNAHPPSKAGEVTLLNREFTGHILDWTHYVEKSRAYEPPAYRLFRGVTPSWDNEARKPGRGTAFVGSTPKLYREWLYNAASDTVRRIARPDERLVFVNAWNEWAEGAHLEPDRKYGYAWLQATNDALTRASAVSNGRRIVVVSHDAYPHGAQFLALNLARVLATEFGFEVATVVLGGGPLKSEFARWGKLYDFEGIDPEGQEAAQLARRLASQGFHAALCNTTVSGRFLRTLTDAEISCVALIHELQGMLAKYQLETHASQIAEHAVRVVFPAATVQRSFEQIAEVPQGNAQIRPQGLYKRNRLRGDRARARSALREKLHLPADTMIVLGVGFADHRKGVDLFARAAALLREKHENVRFVWVGHWEAQIKGEVDRWLAERGATDAVIFTGLELETDLYYAGADVFALTSREDPFPSVVLESLEVGVPVVAFEGATGASELLRQNCGILVASETETELAAAIERLVDDPDLRDSLGANGARLIANDFSFRHYIFDLLDMFGCGLKRTSVVVPNFNYERFIEARLDSILTQTYPIYELIVLDDHSTDGSVERIRAKLANQPVDTRLVVNGSNSGSVFAQWKRGVEFARGDCVWIAEADDLALPDFLARTAEGLSDPDVVLSYSESKQMSESGEILSEHYRDYVADISPTRWNESYVDSGVTEVASALAVKNTIPNVSAVVFRREDLASVLEEHFDEVRRYRVAGDWMVYLRLLERGKIAYQPESLNLHRRHGRSVTIGGFGEAQLKEIRGIQLWVRENHKVAAAVIDTADAYVRKLCEDFDLDESVLEDRTV